MKKIIALLLSLVFIFAFASCGISADADKVEDRLELAGYDVDESDDYDEFKIFLERRDIGTAGVREVIVAYDDKKNDDLLVVIFCKNKSSAKDRMTEVERYLKSESFLDDCEIMGWNPDEYEAKRSGSVVCYGHKEMIKEID